MNHHATLDSARLQRLLAFMRTRGDAGATTWEIVVACQSTNPGRDLSELASCGIGHTTVLESVTTEGKRIYRYRLKPAPEFRLTGEAEGD